MDLKKNDAGLEGSQLSASGANSGVSRRTIVKGAAWSIPVIAAATAVPMASASGVLKAVLTISGTNCVSPGGSLPDAVVTVTDDTGAVIDATVTFTFASTDGGVIAIGGNQYPTPNPTLTLAQGQYTLTGASAVNAGTVIVTATATTADGRTATSLAQSYTVCPAGMLYAWGRDGDGQLVQGVNGNNSSVPLTWKNQDGSVYTEPVVDISGSWASFTILKADGTVWSAGDGLEGELGNGATNRPIQPYPMPAKFADSSNVTGITRLGGNGGQDTSMVIYSGSTVYGTGENHGLNYDMFAIGRSDTYLYSYTPIGTKLPGGATDIKDVAISNYNVNFFLKNDGTVYAAGQNAFMKGGWGSTNTNAFSNSANGYQTVKKSDGTNLIATAVEANERHTVFIGADGLLYGAGYNESGALPGLTVGQQYGYATPLQALPSGTPVQIWTGYNKTFVKSSDGNVYAAGGNNYQALGTGSTTATNNSWARVDIPGDIVDVSSSNYYWSGFLTSAGKVYFAGNGGEGQPGNGAAGTYSTPVEVPAPAGTTRATAIATTHEGAFSAAWV